MNRRNLIIGTCALLGTGGLASVFASNNGKSNSTSASKKITMAELLNLDQNPESVTAIKVPDSEWKQHLEADAYRVLRKEGTERPQSSHLNSEKRDGQYLCAGCGLALFNSDSKYESGTGWPSFFSPIEGRLATKTDFKIGLPRKEYHCARCGGHQGHVFKDGPKPTGLRYCNNGVALRFSPIEN